MLSAHSLPQTAEKQKCLTTPNKRFEAAGDNMMKGAECNVFLSKRRYSRVIGHREPRNTHRIIIIHSGSAKSLMRFPVIIILPSTKQSDVSVRTPPYHTLNTTSAPTPCLFSLDAIIFVLPGSFLISQMNGLPTGQIYN